MAEKEEQKLNPLLVLRNFVRSGKVSEIKEEDGLIKFGDVLRVPPNTETIYKDSSRDGERVSIISALLVVKTKRKRFEYVSEMGKRNLKQFIGMKEMEDLFDYLTGVIEDSANIENDESTRSQKKRKTTDKSGGGDAPTRASGGGSGTAADAQQHTKHTRVHSQISMEVASRDRNQLIASPGIDHSFALKLYEQAHLKSHTGGQGELVGATSLAGPSTYLKKKKDHRLPIIIVPNTSTSLMSMFNIKQFLTDGKFVEGSKLASSGAVKSSKEVFTRRITSLGSQGGAVKETQYMVIDSATRLAPEDWDRVVAVVSLGKEWQFKGWKWPTPVELFSNVLGLYIKWDNEAVPPLVAKWNVKILDISKNRRNLDSSSSIKFWSMVDDFTRINNPAFYRGFD